MQLIKRYTYLNCDDMIKAIYFLLNSIYVRFVNKLNKFFDRLYVFIWASILNQKCSIARNTRVSYRRIAFFSNIWDNVSVFFSIVDDLIWHYIYFDSSVTDKSYEDVLFDVLNHKRWYLWWVFTITGTMTLLVDVFVACRFTNPVVSAFVLIWNIINSSLSVHSLFITCWNTQITMVCLS